MQSACTTTLRVDSRQRFPQLVGVGSWPQKSALTFRVAAFSRLQLIFGGVEESEVLRHVRDRIPGAGPPGVRCEKRRRNDGDGHFAELASIGLPE
jgi:hypothetical protein